MTGWQIPIENSLSMHQDGTSDHSIHILEAVFRALKRTTVLNEAAVLFRNS
jgi:hypothetical protein